MSTRLEGAFLVIAGVTMVLIAVVLVSPAAFAWVMGR